MCICMSVCACVFHTDWLHYIIIISQIQQHGMKFLWECWEPITFSYLPSLKNIILSIILKCWQVELTDLNNIGSRVLIFAANRFKNTLEASENLAFSTAAGTLENNKRTDYAVNKQQTILNENYKTLHMLKYLCWKIFLLKNISEKFTILIIMCEI